MKTEWNVPFSDLNEGVEAARIFRSGDVVVGNSEITDRLLDAVGNIRAAQLKVNDASYNLEMSETVLSVIEAGIYPEVSGEKNEAARKHAMTIKLHEDKEYQAKLESHRHLTKVKDHALADLHLQQNLFSALKVIARQMTAQNT
jgi:hypothetical protein